MTVEIADIADFPLLNMDVKNETGFPPPVAQLRRRIQDADGLVIASPEYNHSFTGVLKNAIDWLSMGADSPLQRKPTAILGAGGRIGTAKSQAALRLVLAHKDVAVLNRPEVLLAGAGTHFDDDLNLVDERSQEQVRRLMFALGGQIRLHRMRDQAVLVGADDALVEAAGRLLDEAGYEVHTTTDPEWAIGKLQTGGFSLCVLEDAHAKNEKLKTVSADAGTRVIVFAGVDGLLDSLDLH